MIFNWNKDKNQILKEQRNISFEEIVSEISNGKIIDIIENPSANFNNQKCFVIEISAYIWLVPYVQNEEEIFLKTAFPSRKHQKIYLKNQGFDNEKI
ncbi:MAG: toxin [Arcobacter sp.]|nr:toxin [Arcobacter sp.]